MPLGRHPGGMAVNQAMEAARYVSSIELLGKLGDDAEGRELRASMGVHGIGIGSLLTDSSAPTGQAYMFLVGDDYFSVVVPGANSTMTAAEAEAAVMRLESGRLILSLEIPEEAAAAALAMARRRGIETVLVASPPEVCTAELLRGADWVIVNRRESQLLFGLAAKTLDQTAYEVASLPGPLRLLVTLSEEGAVLRIGRHLYRAHSFPAEAVNPVGAGDALAGAFVAALSLNIDPQQALEIGCVAGALALAGFGIRPSSHSASHVVQLAEKHYSDTSMEVLQ